MFIMSNANSKRFHSYINNWIVDGSYVITSGSDKKIKLWNPQSGLLLKTYGGHANEVSEAIGSCDSCHILSGSLDRSLIYWDVTTAQPLRRLRCHAGGVSCIAFSEDSNVAFSGMKNSEIHTHRKWNTDKFIYIYFAYRCKGQFGNGLGHTNAKTRTHSNDERSKRLHHKNHCERIWNRCIIVGWLPSAIWLTEGWINMRRSWWAGSLYGTNKRHKMHVSGMQWQCATTFG